MISTRITRMLGIRHPVIQAGMGGVARAELVAAVSNAGALRMRLPHAGRRQLLDMIRPTTEFIREQIRRTQGPTDNAPERTCL